MHMVERSWVSEGNASGQEDGARVGDLQLEPVWVGQLRPRYLYHNLLQMAWINSSILRPKLLLQ